MKSDVIQGEKALHATKTNCVDLLWLFFSGDVKWFLHVCTHAHAPARSCVWSQTARRGSRRNGPFYLFAQLSGGDFAVSFAFLLLLKACKISCGLSQALGPTPCLQGLSGHSGSLPGLGYLLESMQGGWRACPP